MTFNPAVDRSSIAFCRLKAMQVPSFDNSYLAFYRCTALIHDFVS